MSHQCVTPNTTWSHKSIYENAATYNTTNHNIIALTQSTRKRNDSNLPPLPSLQMANYTNKSSLSGPSEFKNITQSIKKYVQEYQHVQMAQFVQLQEAMASSTQTLLQLERNVQKKELNRYYLAIPILPSWEDYKALTKENDDLSNEIQQMLAELEELHSEGIM